MPGPGRGHDGRWSHFDDPTSRFDPRMGGTYADEPTVQLRPYRGGHHGAPAPWWRSRTALAVASSFLAVVLIGTVAFIALRPESTPAAAGPAGSTSSTPSGSPSPSASPTPSSSPSPSPTPTSAPPPVQRPQEVVTERPPPVELPPPPPPPAPPVDPSCVRGPGDAPLEEVRTALAVAGAEQYWIGVQAPSGWPGGPYPAITIPADLMYAIAVTESCWRSTAVGEYGEVGLMQVRSDTASWMNQRFHRSYDINSVNGNAAIGAMYLEWLVMYFGLYYFGTYDLNASMPVGTNGAMVRLGDAVIAAYNVGYHNVENLNGTPDDGSDDTIQIGPVGQQYLNKVKNNLAARTWETL